MTKQRKANRAFSALPNGGSRRPGPLGAIMRTLRYLNIFIIALTIATVLHGQTTASNGPCKTEIDSITKRLVYTAADMEPLNEGGENTLRKRFATNVTTTNIPIDTKNYDPIVIVAFIVDKDGSIKGERIVNDKTNNIGGQMLNIVKSFRWTPAKCNGKSVAMILKRQMIVDISEQ
jgi:hypothetical protein